MNQILYRHREDKMIGGVAGGVAVFLGQDVTLVRVVIAALALLSSGGVLLAYLVAWAMMPEGPPAADGSLGPSYLDQWSGKGHPTPSPPKTAQPPAAAPAAHTPAPRAPAPGQTVPTPGTGARWLGFALIAVGVVALLERYLPRFDAWELWPVIIIVIGLATVIGRGRD